MRRFRRSKSATKSASLNRRLGNGLNTRTSMLGCASSADSVPSSPDGVRIVEQHAHAHAAFGGLPRGLGEQLSGRVAVPDVVLQVEASLRGARQEHAHGEGVAPLAERLDAGQAGVPFQMCSDRATEGRVLRHRQHRRRRALDRGRQAGATGQQRKGGEGGQLETFVHRNSAAHAIAPGSTRVERGVSPAGARRSIIDCHHRGAISDGRSMMVRRFSSGACPGATR